MIYFENVSKIYNGNCVALDNITLRIRPQEFVSLAGPSGAGKSTLLKLLIGEDKPTQGKIMLDNQNLNLVGLGDLPKIRRKIGMVFQDFRLLANRTAYENIAFAMEVAGDINKEIEQDVPQVLDVVGLADKTAYFPHQLSGGEKQRIAIARALIHRPSVILADEPTGNLDLLNTWDIIKLLLKINELGTTIILATHDREIINNLGRRVITLDKGKMIRDEEKGRYVL
ncbi:MAG: cell division ATP-binding protein FtsE [Parcubacteria group bacterium CG1_02_40_82]|uniref:Cell division ATP-binding protein FtsE n=4 Tax=Candidatus Portnoyibacteriota TaxID=1817913 RepID=A0A2M7IH64_9BACT|nr:MAG: cell division ATP-binding protein FtsE [Parcubacteria group bacterium CG1_02_40_82]PIQ74840.1 MAG: cell division ATP-binding protein FtsE [Candidatus Portnoybacteria bacterium CG11_big_fil_rev_8_21_14_0_20_40_15]PIW75870.1 MAG: cell division ATP-binding protein FtsE [Candidatus Portnoybacteria bacterium CG_4_8_14_3_um_filter_40_10]PIY75061.1 MAG: cell division ATP-binding protein FtsE [Candidatus Portnoybacteria bacterium CG_4_10_14_0_8_um_filter_40_50]